MHRYGMGWLLLMVLHCVLALTLEAAAGALALPENTAIGPFNLTFLEGGVGYHIRSTRTRRCSQPGRRGP